MINMTRGAGIAAAVALTTGLVAVLQPSGGCVNVASFLTEERSGNVEFIFTNDTDYRALFSFGTYDAFDRTPGPVSLDQLRLEAHTSSTAVVAPCRRIAAVGTEDYIQRVLDTEADKEAEDFDPDAFNATVRFSSFPADSRDAGLPDKGTVAGIEVRLGVDFACEDLLIFTFSEDPAAPGVFRIDFTRLGTGEDE